MKIRFCVCLGILFVLQAFAQQNVDSEKHALAAKMQQIGVRVANGDYAAFSDAAKLPTSTALRFLFILYNRGAKTDPARDSAAIEALRSVPGYADYLRLDMAERTSQGRIPGQDFEILELIGTQEAAAVAAPYLFDFKTISPDQGDAGGDSNVSEAMIRLARMHLEDGVTNNPYVTNSATLIAWQKWAIAKGFVPKDWSSRIGAPDWMLKLEAAERAMYRPLPTIPPRQNQPASSPLPPTTNTPVPTKAPSTSAGIPSPMATKAPKHVQTENGAHAPIVLLIAGLAIIFIGAAIAWKWLKK